MNELFLILDAFGDRSQFIAYLLEPLTELAVRPTQVRVHYREDIDVALIQVVFSSPDDHGLERFRELALRIGIKVIDANALGAAERRRFYIDQLATYPLLFQRADLADAVVALRASVVAGRKRRDETVDLGPRHRRAASSPGSYRFGRSPERADPPAPLVGGARGTRDELIGPDDLAQGTTSGVQTSHPRPPRFTAPLEQARPVVDPNRIAVRVGRGDQWLPGRLRFLSARRVEVAAASTPQVGDPVILELSFRGTRLTVTGIVERVQRAPNLSTPVSTGFSASLAALSESERRDLGELLQRAAKAGIRLSPPALRPARFAVSWPLIVSPKQGDPQRVTAMDISLGGMFLQKRPLSGQLAFAMPLDEPGASAIRGRFEVVRDVAPETVEALGGSAGTGVALRGFAADGRERYERFVARIRERNNRRLMVAAAPDRLGALVSNLRGAGYAVTSSSDPSEIVELASSRLRPDVAVVDHGLTGLASETELLLTILREHHLFTLASSGERADETRRAVDELLGI